MLYHNVHTPTSCTWYTYKIARIGFPLLSQLIPSYHYCRPSYSAEKVFFVLHCFVCIILSFLIMSGAPLKSQKAYWVLGSSITILTDTSYSQTLELCKWVAHVSNTSWNLMTSKYYNISPRWDSFYFHSNLVLDSDIC